MAERWPYNADKYRRLSIQDASHIRDLLTSVEEDLRPNQYEARLDVREAREKAADIIARLTLAKNGERVESLERETA